EVSEHGDAQADQENGPSYQIENGLSISIDDADDPTDKKEGSEQKDEVDHSLIRHAWRPDEDHEGVENTQNKDRRQRTIQSGGIPPCFEKRLGEEHAPGGADHRH